MKPVNLKTQLQLHQEEVVKLKILGHNYTVSNVENLARDRGNGGGECIPAALTINIDPSLPRTRREENLLHEIFEALKYHLALELPHDKLSAMSEGLYAVMKDNRPIFTGFMVHDDET